MNFRNIAAAAALSLSAIGSHAATIPVGVHNDVTSATVASWGFTQCYAGTYGTSGVSINSLVSACQAGGGDVLMLAARRVGSQFLMCWRPHPLPT